MAKTANINIRIEPETKENFLLNAIVLPKNYLMSLTGRTIKYAKTCDNRHISKRL